MTDLEWKERLTGKMKEAGVYQPFFEEVVNTLAGILAMRDKAIEELKDQEMTIEHVNKYGACNQELNPVLRLIREYDKLAIMYMRELCLTPASHSRVKLSTTNNVVSFEELLDGAMEETK